MTSAQPGPRVRQVQKSKTFIVGNELERARLVAWLQAARLRNEDNQPMVWKVTRRKPKRSLSQNALFHAWVHILAVFTGETDEKMKEDLKRALLPLIEVRNKFTGEVRLEPRHTSDLAKVEMSEFMTRVQALARDHFEITLPSPDDPASFDAIEEAA